MWFYHTYTAQKNFRFRLCAENGLPPPEFTPLSFFAGSLRHIAQNPEAFTVSGVSLLINNYDAVL